MCIIQKLLKKYYVKGRHFCDHKLLRNLFLRLRHEKNVFCENNVCDLGILWKKMRNLFLRPHCFNKIVLTKSKKEDTIYMGIIYTVFLSRNLLCKNIYTMSLFMRMSIPLLYLVFSFLTYEVSYSKKCKHF